MSGDSKGVPVGSPDRPHEPKDIYGGVWGHCEPLGEDTSGRGSAPRAPGSPAPGAPAPGAREPLTFIKPEGEENDGPEIAADDAGASSRSETPQPKTPGTRKS
jgi:hypothetical protein